MANSKSSILKKLLKRQKGKMPPVLPSPAIPPAPMMPPQSPMQGPPMTPPQPF